MEKDSLF